mgnify:FL=1
MSTNNEQVNGKRRGSLQREVIYETLKGTTAHPDVDAILAMIKDKLPGIGVATVYRNLRALVDEGRVVTLETSLDSIHYDADVSDHAHFVCRHCGRISDLFIGSPLTKTVEELGYEVEEEKSILYGLCPDCAKESRLK